MSSENTTDPANEFAKAVAHIINQQPNSGHPTYQVFGEILNQTRSESAVTRFYASSNRRADRLCKLINSYKDDILDDDLAVESITAVRNLQKIFLPNYCGTSWNTVRAYPTAQDFTAIKYTSKIIKSRCQLRLISADDINRIVKAIESADAEIDNDSQLIEWHRLLLKESISDLRFFIDNFHLFGHDDIFDEMLKLHDALVVIRKSTPKASGGNGKNILKTLALFVLLTDVFTLPATVNTAISFYSGLVTEISQKALPTFAPEPKQLPPPSKTEK